jgi:hypothetical protein
MFILYCPISQQQNISIGVPLSRIWSSSQSGFESQDGSSPLIEMIGWGCGLFRNPLKEVEMKE